MSTNLDKENFRNLTTRSTIYDVIFAIVDAGDDEKKINRISLKNLSEKVKGNRKVVEQILQVNGDEIRYVPLYEYIDDFDERWTDENDDGLHDNPIPLGMDKTIAELAVSQKGQSIKWLKNPKYGFVAQKPDPINIQTASFTERNKYNVDFEKWTIWKNIAIKAVTNDYLALGKLGGNDAQKDVDVITAAINQNGLAIELADDDVQWGNSELVIKAINQNPEVLYNYEIYDGMSQVEKNFAAQFFDERNGDVILSLLEKNGMELQLFPKLQDSDLYVQRAVTQNGLAIQFASDRLKNEVDILDWALEQNGLALQYASDSKRKNYGMVLLAVQQNGKALQYALVGSDDYTDNVAVVKAATEQDPLSILIANSRFTNPELDDSIEKKDVEQILANAVEKDNRLIQFVPSLKSNKTAILGAVRKDPKLLSVADDSLKKDKVFIKSCFEISHEALAYADASITDDNDYIKKRIIENPKAILYASNRIKTDFDFYINNMEEIKVGVLEYAPNSIKDDYSVIQAAVYEDPMAIQYASAFLKNDNDLARLVLEENGLGLQYLSPSIKDDEGWVKTAVEQNPLALQYASEKRKNDPELLKGLISKDGLYLKNIDESIRNDEELVKAAVKQNPLAIKYASKKIRGNIEIMNMAVEKNGDALVYASDVLKENTDEYNKLLVKAQKNVGLSLNEEKSSEVTNKQIKEMGDDINDNKQEITNLVTKTNNYPNFTDLQQDIVDINEELQKVSPDGLDDMKSDITLLKENVDAAASTNDLNKEKTALLSKTLANQLLIDDVNEKIKEINEKISVLNNINVNTESINDVNRRVAIVESSAVSIPTLEDNIVTINTTLGLINTSLGVTATKSDVNTITDTQTTQATDITTLKADVTILKGAIDVLPKNEKITELNDEITSTKTKSDQNADIIALTQRSLNQLKTDVSALPKLDTVNSELDETRKVVSKNKEELEALSKIVSENMELLRTFKLIFNHA